MLSNKWTVSLCLIAAIVGLSIGACAPPPPALSVAVTADTTSGNAPLTVTTTATPSGGVAPYIYLWTSQPGGVIAKPLQASTNILFVLPGTYTVTCTVTDSSGQVTSGSVTITVTEVIIGNPVAGLALYTTDCAGCHQNNVGGAQPLTSADVNQITNDMRSLSPLMAGIPILTDQQVADLKAYLATVP